MQNSSPATIKAWMQGEEQAVRTIFNTYYPLAVRIAVLSGLEPEAAQDCAQEAFVQAFERRYQLRDPKAFPLWFHRIVTNHTMDILRKRRRSKEFSLEVVDELEDWERYQAPQPDELAVSAEERAQLWRNVQRLSPLYRVPLVLRYYSDFSLREVAELMGKREGAIRVIIHRALQQLRAFSWEHSAVEQTPPICCTEVSRACGS